MSDKLKLALTVREAAAATGLGVDAIYTAIRDGHLPARKLGSRTLILRTDLDRFLEGLQPLKLGPDSDRSKHGRRVRQASVRPPHSESA